MVIHIDLYIYIYICGWEGAPFFAIIGPRSSTHNT